MIKNYKKILALVLLPSFGGVGGGFLVGSCTPSEEEIGAEMVSRARVLMRHQQYDAARDTIFSLRQNHPTAIEARKEAILLLDSVELLAAIDSLAAGPAAEDSARLVLKCEFYTRKIDFDKSGKSQ